MGSHPQLCLVPALPAGPETSHEAVREIRDAIREDRSCDVCLLNYRKDGSTFWQVRPVCLSMGGLSVSASVCTSVTLRSWSVCRDEGCMQLGTSQLP